MPCLEQHIQCSFDCSIGLEFLLPLFSFLLQLAFLEMAQVLFKLLLLWEHYLERIQGLSKDQLLLLVEVPELSQQRSLL
jgi:hypothetical protein